jgi:hypothetical protein
MIDVARRVRGRKRARGRRAWRACAWRALACAWLGCFAAARPARAAEPRFEAFWRDGKAEVDGYRLTVQRYGAARTGRAVLIYVTEPFSASRHVKVDDPMRAPADTFEAFKLNLVRRFQTGIYDYETMVSLFDRAADLSPVKVAFSASEWCGQVYEQLDLVGAKLTGQIASYFEDESGSANLSVPADALLEDQLFVWLRGLRGAPLQPGQAVTRPYLAGAFWRRLAHQRLAWSTAKVERLAPREVVRVPAGAFAVSTYVVRPADGRVGRFDVEEAHPHRVVRWSWAPAPGAPPLGGTDSAELAGSARLEYWRLHDPGDERYLKSLGLEPR